MAYPRFQRSRAHKYTADSAGDITLNGTSWAAVHATRGRHVIHAQIGDVIECACTFSLGNENVQMAMDFGIIVSNAIARRSSGGADAGLVYALGGSYAWLSMTGWFTVEASDLVNDMVEIAIVYKGNTANNRTLRASLERNALVFGARNLGPAAE